MQQLESYIKSIVKDLNISKTQMEEITDEFRDHLEMLTKDYINQGYTEEAAIAKAIESFGNDNLLRKKLSRSLNCYRSTPNVLFGIGYLLFILFAYKMYMNTQFQYLRLSSDMSLFQMISDAIIRVTPIATIVFSPIGYFLPIIFKQINKLRYIVGINSLLSMVYICYVIYSIYKAAVPGVNTPYFVILVVVCQVLSIICGVLLSAVLGYKLLNLVNNKLFKSRRTMSI